MNVPCIHIVHKMRLFFYKCMNKIIKNQRRIPILNKLWPIFIIVYYIYAIFTGNAEQINNSVFESCENAVQLSITFLGTMCLWNGIMQIAKTTTLINKLTNILSPIMSFLFPDIKKESEVHKEISMNMVANILGLGNAATPLGLKAMKSLQKDNNTKDTLSDSMAMFIIINTASIQLIPTTVIAEIIPPYNIYFIPVYGNDVGTTEGSCFAGSVLSPSPHSVHLKSELP